MDIFHSCRSFHLHVQCENILEVNRAIKTETRGHRNQSILLPPHPPLALPLLRPHESHRDFLAEIQLAPQLHNHKVLLQILYFLPRDALQFRLQVNL